jgi:hypothetical protein
MPLITARSLVPDVVAMLGERRPAEPGWQRVGEPVPQAVTERSYQPAASAQALRGRRPAGRLTPAALSLAQLQQVLTSAFAAHNRDWPQPRCGPAGLVVLVAASRVTGLPSGTYAADLERRKIFIRLAGRPCDTEIPGRYGSAAAVLHICGDLSAACSGGGSGYGSLLVRAGALGRAAWLSAQPAHLDGTVHGTASRHVTSIARSFDGGLRHLLSVALGVGSGDDEHAHR